MRDRILPTILLTLTALLADPAARAQIVPEPIPLENLGGEVVNFETPLVRPILVTADGAYLVAVNEPDDRVVVRDATTLSLVAEIPAGQGLTALAERPGGAEIWVSAMHSSAVVVIDATTWTVSHVLRAPSGRAVGVGDASSPGGIEFSADGSKAWVTATATDSLVVWDGVTKQHLATVPVAVDHNGTSTRVKEPRSILRVGDTIYLAAFRSGNQTLAGPVEFFGLHPSIIDLNAIAGLSLPDADILAFSAIDESPLFHQEEIGQLIFAVSYQASSDRLVVASMDGRNGELIGEGSFPQGRMALNTLTLLTPGDAPADYIRVPLEDLGSPGSEVQVAMPTALAIDGSDRIYVAGYASANLGVFDASGTFLGSLPTDAGPRGLAVSPDGATLYSLNRIAGTITTYDVSGALPPGPANTVSIGLYDPTWENVAAGRALYNDATNSGGGSTGCFSCHPDLQQDGLGWDLSAYLDPGDGFTPANPPGFWDDRKFSMTTQDLRSLEDTAPYHWRGEMKDVDGFNGAFRKLIKGTELDVAGFADLKAYLFSAVYPPNPFESVDREAPPEVFGGSVVFRNSDVLGVGNDPCGACHLLPTGSRGSISSRFVTGLAQPGGNDLVALDTPHLRGTWTKASDGADVREDAGTLLVPVSGFGFDHTGSHSSVRNFVETQFPEFTPRESNAVIDFIEQMDSGLAPCAAWAARLDSLTAGSSDAPFLVQQADLGNCDLAARGLLDTGNGLAEIGLVYDPNLLAFVASDSGLGPFGLDTLIQKATDGEAELLLLGVPVGSGERMGVDRDRDASFDLDEVAAGTDPASPDTDGDGFWDSYDDHPLVFDDTVANTQPPVVEDLEVSLVTANSVRVVYHTDTFSPTRVVYGETTDYGQAVGDETPLPAGSNRWKRHHSIVLRGLDDGKSYHFQVETLGQNGIGGTSADQTVVTLSDAISEVPETVRVIDISLAQGDGGGGVRTFTATVEVANNLLQAAEGLEVRGIWTLFDAGQPVLQLDSMVGVTDASGIAMITAELPPGQPADLARFTIPMYLGDPGSETSAIVDPVGNPVRKFSWSDHVVTASEIPVQ